MICANCGNQNAEASRFCTHCGEKLAPTTPPPSASGGAQRRGRKARRYPIESHRLEELLDKFFQWLGYQQFRYHQLKTKDNGLLVQIAKTGGWRKLVGMNTTLNVVFYPRENNLTVEIGAGRWIDKALAGGVGLFLLWPLAVTAGIGAYEQVKLPGKIFAFINEFANR